jgi:hypothetical protein
MGRAPARGGKPRKAQLAGLPYQQIAQVNVPGTGADGFGATARDNFRANFITGAAYANTAVHYKVRGQAAGFPAQAADALAKNACRSAAPAGVKQGDPPTRGDQVDRDTIGDRYGKEDAPGGSNPAVDTLDLDPAGAGIQAHDLHAMDLIAKSDSLKSADGATEGEPAAHHIADRLLAPETEIEASARIGATTSDPGDYAVPFLPIRDLEARDISRDRRFPDLDDATDV